MVKILFALLPLMGLQAADPAPKHYPAVILGGGPGALTSALYLSRFGVVPLVIEGELVGGRISQSHKVQNWPGELEIAGTELTEKLRNQVVANGAVLLSEKVTRVDLSSRPFTFTTQSLFDPSKKNVFTADVCIIAMGTKPNLLGVPGEKEFWGKGVTNCAVCDGPLMKDKAVVIVGGGDAALLEAEYLSQIAKSVDILVRGNNFRSIEEKRKEEILKKPNVKVHFQTRVKKIVGSKENVTSVVINEKGKEKSLPIDGVFLAIGSTPNTELFKDSLELDEKGYIFLQKGQRTTVPGVYAIGDIADPIYKQAISAAGDGAKAAIEAYYEELSHTQSTQSEQKKEEASQPVVGKVKEIESQQEFEKIIKTSPIPVIVDFYASWCGPCKQIAPIFEQKAKALSKDYLFLKVNVDSVSSLAEKYSVRSMPTTILLKGGKEQARHVGSSEIVQMLEECSPKR